VFGLSQQHVAALLQGPQDCALKNGHHVCAPDWSRDAPWNLCSEQGFEPIFRPQHQLFQPTRSDRPEPGLRRELLPGGCEVTPIATVREADLVGVRAGHNSVPYRNKLLLAEPNLGAIV